MTPTISQSELTRAGALYLPVLLALMAGIYQRSRPSARIFPATLLSALWPLPSLLLLQQVNLHAHWWTYAPGSAAMLLGMPVELYLGWTVLWGVLPPLALLPLCERFTDSIGGRGRLALPLAAFLLIVFDLTLMPACRAAVTLGPRWLLGEGMAVLLVLLPALVLARATQRNTHLEVRAALQLLLAGGLFLYWIPELTATLSHTPLRVNAAYRLWLPLAGVLALPGLGAVVEFAQRGRGTPIPYDPPVRLVTSGIYRYVANPMQLSCSLVMAAVAGLFSNAWLLIPAALSVVYSAGIAAWDEGEDLRARFGQPWVEYRREVHNWLPRLSPYADGAPGKLYFAHSCAACSQVGGWVAAQHPAGLQLLAAESLADTPTRLLYVPATGNPDRGTRAFGRALEHLNLGYALAGILLRLPGPAHLVQLVMDTSGFDAQTLAGASCERPAQGTTTGS